MDFADMIKGFEIETLSGILLMDPKYNHKCPYKREVDV